MTITSLSFQTKKQTLRFFVSKSEMMQQTLYKWLFLLSSGSCITLLDPNVGYISSSYTNKNRRLVVFHYGYSKT